MPAKELQQAVVHPSEAEARQLRQDLEFARPSAATGKAAGLHRYIELLCRLHGIRVLYRRDSALANHTGHFVAIPEALDVMPAADAQVAAATGFHEVAHLLCGPCPGTGLHFQQLQMDFSYCLRCELDAWAKAMLLAPIWSKAMQTTMATALQSYRKSVPAPIDVVNEVDGLCDNAAFEREQTRRERWTQRITRQRRVDESLIPPDVRNRELNAEIGRQRGAYRELQRARKQQEAVLQTPCACGRRAIATERLTSGALRGLCSVCRDAAVAEWRASVAGGGATTGTGTSSAK